MARPNLDIGWVVLSCVLLSAPGAWGQSTSGISGVVKDTSNAVLPGVTVEAASPALIEKVRTAVTDDQGRYNLSELRPGTYTVTFTLAGFRSLKREGVGLSAGFTATVNADMQVGGLEESITVTGEAPLVDTRNVRQQTVISDELLAVLPTGQTNLSSLVALTPGYTGNATVGGSSGAFIGQQMYGTFHGKAGTNVQYDGMRIQNFSGGGSPGYDVNQQMVEETVVATGGMSAETSATGMAMNMIPKEGSNSWRFTAAGLYTNDRFQSSNLTDELRARGLTRPSKVLNIYDAGGTVGGPIKKDRLWFFGALRAWGNRGELAGIFWNKTQGTMFYTPDLDRPASRNEWYQSNAARLTWQVSPRNKVNTFADIKKECLCLGTAVPSNFGTNAPESATGWRIWPTGIVQGTWSSPVTSKFLLEAGAAAVIFHWPHFRQPGVTPNDISILELSTNSRYNAPSGLTPVRNVTDRFVQRFGMSYVTGSHAVKVGFQLDEGIIDAIAEGQGPDGVTYTFLRGVPASLTQRALPSISKAIGKAELGIYAQDQWTVNRLTLNLGLRYDYFNGMVPELHVGAGPFVPARDYAAVHKVPEWKDLNPRLGASFDLFGDGRTAIKASLGRYGDLTGSGIISQNSPLSRSVSSVTRSWRDNNLDYHPDCNLANFNAQSPATTGSIDTCGAVSDSNFGKNNPLATLFAEDVLRGWGIRRYTWDFATELQHQLGAGASITGGYYRNWGGNFRVTDNLAVTPADHDPYCIVSPLDPRLPGGGGYQVCGFYDLNPAKFGQSSNLVTQASNFQDPQSKATCGSQTLGMGEACGTSDFLSLNFSTRFKDTRLGGGVDTGRTVRDSCFVIDSPEDLQYCHVVIPWSAQTQVKLHASYPLPGAFALSATYQNLPGLNIQANYPAPTAVIAPTLGRPLSGNRSSATVPLIAPYTQFEPRRAQLDLRLTKVVQLSPKVRLQANFDLYNVLNDSSVLTQNNTFGPLWRRPTLVLDGRLAQVSAKLDF